MNHVFHRVLPQIPMIRIHLQRICQQRSRSAHYAWKIFGPIILGHLALTILACRTISHPDWWFSWLPSFRHRSRQTAAILLVGVLQYIRVVVGRIYIYNRILYVGYELERFQSSFWVFRRALAIPILSLARNIALTTKKGAWNIGCTCCYLGSSEFSSSFLGFTYNDISPVLPFPTSEGSPIPRLWRRRGRLETSELLLDLGTLCSKREKLKSVEYLRKAVQKSNTPSSPPPRIMATQTDS